MAVKIHHGPPGSYKTAGAVNDDYLQAVKAGRVVVTNVRGLTREKTIEALDEVPESFDVIHVDTSTQEGREKFANWFHWVPMGAFILVDEAQSIFPKYWTAADLARLNFPGGFDAAWKAKRPANWHDAWDMHRHYNWDIVLTTPKITKIRDDIRGVSEIAYKHKNLALVSFFLKGRYLEAAHASEDNGTSVRDFVSEPVRRKVDPVVWSLYESTATGAHSDTKFGSELFKNPRVLLLLACLATALYFGFRGDTPAVLGGPAKHGPAPSSASVSRPQTVPVSASTPWQVSSPGTDLGSSHADPLPGLTAGPLVGVALFVRGSVTRAAAGSEPVVMFDAVGDGVRFDTDSRQLKKAGYEVVTVADCMVNVFYARRVYRALCGRPDDGEAKDKTVRNPGTPAGPLPSDPVAQPIKSAPPVAAAPVAPPVRQIDFKAS